MQRYQPRSPLQAIDPHAFLGFFLEAEKPVNEQLDDMTIVTVRGPLSQHDGWWEDSYESIRKRVDEACQQAAPNVVMCIDSPGGDVSGCFDTARAIRAACDRAGKRLLVHVEGQCCSAAYALAAAADKITASRTASVGSIGVIAVRLDETRALENQGYKLSLITSGARKADGFPCSPMSADELATFQADIDGLAAEFFDLVAVRRGISTKEIAAFEAATFRGAAAIAAGLVDELGSFDHVIASLGASANGDTMNEEEKKARDALRSLAEDEERSEEEREKARRALAALDGEEEEEQDDEEASAEEDEEQAENDEEEQATAPASTVSASTAGAIAAHGTDVEKRLERLERREKAADVKRRIAAHGGVSKGMAKILATKPLEEVKALLAELPKPRKPKLGDHAATATVPSTQGADQGKASQLKPEEGRAMRRAMGLEADQFGVVERGNALLLGAPKTEGGES